MPRGLRGRERELVDELLRRGWWCERVTGSGHLKVMHPSGRHIIVSLSPGDRRGWYNLRANARRIEQGLP